MEKKINEARGVLKERKEFHKILEAMKEKYIKTGKLTGKVELKDITLEESIALSPFCNEIYGESQGKVSINRFINYFTKGRFEGVDFTEVFLLYYDGNLKTNREKKNSLDEDKEMFFEKILSCVDETKIQLWLIYLFEYKKYGYNILVKQYNDDKNFLKEIISNLERSVEFIPFSQEDEIPLPTLASKASKDSHYFDINKTAGKLLLHFLAFTNDKQLNFTLEEVNNILMENGIIRDEISNFTITAGLFCYDEEEEVHGTKWFRSEMESLILNLQNLKKFKSIKARVNKVFVFENPTSFYEVLNGCKDLSPSLICIRGQPNTSTHFLFKKLVEEDTIIYYSGDFDPEGINICDNLKHRYGNALSFMCMDEANYIKIKLENDFISRECKLDSLRDEKLICLAKRMKAEKMSGYQELLTKEYMEFIKNELS